MVWQPGGRLAVGREGRKGKCRRRLRTDMDWRI